MCFVMLFGPSNEHFFWAPLKRALFIETSTFPRAKKVSIWRSRLIRDIYTIQLSHGSQSPYPYFEVSPIPTTAAGLASWLQHGRGSLWPVPWMRSGRTKTGLLNHHYPMVRRERFGAFGVFISYHLYIPYLIWLDNHSNGWYYGSYMYIYIYIHIHIWLVGGDWSMTGLFFHMQGMSSSDFQILQRDRCTTSQGLLNHQKCCFRHEQMGVDHETKCWLCNQKWRFIWRAIPKWVYFTNILGEL